MLVVCRTVNYQVLNSADLLVVCLVLASLEHYRHAQLPKKAIEGHLIEDLLLKDGNLEQDC